MAYYIVQGGTTLKSMTTAGALTSLTLPTGITLDSTKRLRGAVLNGVAVLVNSPNENLTVDRFGVVRLLCPAAPATPPVLSAVSGGTLTGTFTAWVTHIVKDAFGNLLAESDFSPTSSSQAVTTQYLGATVPVSPQTITGLGRRMYRSTTGPGTVKFPWMDLDDNTQTSIQDDVSDTGLQTVAAPTDLGQPPRFELITKWKDRLWGKSPDAIDTLYQSANGKMYAFPASRTIPIPAANDDTKGITGFLARRDALGVGKATSLHKITGTNENNFTRVTESEGVGVWAADSCVVAHDIGYFLGNPFGIYTWGPGGVTNVSNAKVKAWFETDTYFNRAVFDQAVGMYDPKAHAYVVFLCSAGSTTLDRWIQYDIATGTWWGPHKTDAITIAAGGTMLRDANDVAIACVFGSDGKIYKPTTTKTDSTATAIDFDVTTNWLSGNTPTVMKTFLEPEIATVVQAGGTLTVTPKVGLTSASAGTAISHDMTKGHERLPRLGDGELCQLRFRENTAGQAVSVLGIEIPFFEVGRR